MSSIFTNWAAGDETMLGAETMDLEHSLASSDLFTDSALSRLIEQTAREDYHISTMDPASHDPKSRREGVIDGLSGPQVLEAIGQGNLWLNLRDPGKYQTEYKELLDAIYDELEMRVPGLNTFKRQMTLLISSPSVRVGYHCDVPGQTLWQIRGRKRVWLYPNTDPYLPQPSLEKILLGEAHEVSLQYNPRFDDNAQVVDLEPGHMLTWPHNAPHRVENYDCLNISITTEHWTPELRNSYAVNYANGILRSRLGMNRLSQSTNGLSFYPKAVLAAAYKLGGIQKRMHHKFDIDFRVDPSAPGGFTDIASYELSD